MISILATSLISMPLLTKCAIFGGVACGAWLLLDIVSKEEAARRIAARRYPRSLAPPQRRHARGVTKRSDGIGRLLEKATPKMAKALQPKTEEDVGKLRAKLNYAGFRTEAAPSVFLGLKIMSLALGFLAGGGAMLFTKGWTTEAGMYTVGIAGIAFYLPDVVLRFFSKARQNNIFFGLPDALDLMVVCVEAGLGLDQAMRKVSEEMKKTYQSHRRRVRPLQPAAPNGPRPQRSAARARRPHRRRRPESPRRDPDPSRQVRLERGPGASACKAIRCAPAAARWPKKKQPRPR